MDEPEETTTTTPSPSDPATARSSEQASAEDAPAAAPRRTRAHGRESRRKIIEAAAAVAGERGYEGTSIAKISKASGLPASSIYWHFKDKDTLLAAVVEEGVDRWLGQVTRNDGSSLQEQVISLCQGVAGALAESPDFIRLGLMLSLEKRPEETAAKSLYLRLRREAVELIAHELREVRPELPAARAHELATYALAGGDGIFLAMQFGEVDVSGQFAMHADAMMHLIDQS